MERQPLEKKDYQKIEKQGVWSGIKDKVDWNIKKSHPPRPQ